MIFYCLVAARASSFVNCLISEDPEQPSPSPLCSTIFSICRNFFFKFSSGLNGNIDSRHFTFGVGSSSSSRETSKIDRSGGPSDSWFNQKLSKLWLASPDKNRNLNPALQKCGLILSGFITRSSPQSRKQRFLTQSKLLHHSFCLWWQSIIMMLRSVYGPSHRHETSKVYCASLIPLVK